MKLWPTVFRKLSSTRPSGIGTSALAIVAYNYFTSKIDELTYSIDEAGFSIIQTFGAQHATAMPAFSKRFSQSGATVATLCRLIDAKT
ncbi:MAG: hypothetical protein WKG07_33480 [Hymenobacter sp.]